MGIVSLDECKFIDLKEIKTTNGSIVSVANNQNFPFSIKRVFYIYDVKESKKRGNHAHKECHQVLIAIKGSFNIIVDNGIHKSIVLLDNPSRGFYIPPGIWSIQENFTQGSVCLVLASTIYADTDYIRKYQEFKNMVINK